MNDEFEKEFQAALRHYGLHPESIAPVAVDSSYAKVFRVRAAGVDYAARVRHPLATPAQVCFAAKWGLAMRDEVPAPMGLLPGRETPRVQGRCVDVAPWIDHEHTRGGEMPPEAWVQVGYWLGCLHRLGLPMTHEAPVDLPYGNYPSNTLVTHWLNLARQETPSCYRRELQEAEDLLVRAREFLAPRESFLPRGVVHGDLHFWNVLYRQDRAVAIIDLDFLQQGYLLADLGYASIWLLAWQRERDGVWRDIQSRYVEAYSRGRHTPINDAERECLPWMGVVYSVFFFLQNILRTPQDESKWRPDLEQARNHFRGLT